MPRTKKSDQLLAKLNRSLDGEAGTTDSAKTSSDSPAANPRPRASRRRRPTADESRRSAPPPPPPPSSDPTSPPAESPAATDSSPARRDTAAKQVRQHVMYASGAGLIPVPLADLAAIGGLQLKLLADLAHTYGVEFSKTQAQAIVTSLVGSIGGTVLACSAMGSLAKFLPGLGSVLSVTTLPVAAGAITYAIGHLAIDHFETGGTLRDFDLDVAESAFARRWQEAKTTVQSWR